MKHKIDEEWKVNFRLSADDESEYNDINWSYRNAPAPDKSSIFLYRPCRHIHPRPSLRQDTVAVCLIFHVFDTCIEQQFIYWHP